MKYIILLSFFFFSSSLVAQSKEFKKDVSQEGNYIVKSNFKKVYTRKEIKDYLEENGYTIIKLKTEEVSKYGNIVDKVSYVKYISPEGLIKEEERKRYANEQSAKAAAVFIGIAGKVVESTIESIKENVDSDTHSTNSYVDDYNDDYNNNTTPRTETSHETDIVITTDFEIEIGDFKGQFASGDNKFSQVKVICKPSNNVLKTFELAYYPNEIKQYQLSGMNFLSTSKWDNLQEFKKTILWHANDGSYGSCY